MGQLRVDSTTSSASPSTPSDSVTFKVGDSLQKIADDHGVDLKDLMAANNITDPNAVLHGREIQIPEKCYVQPEATPSTQSAGPQLLSSPAAGSVDAKSMAAVNMRQTTTRDILEKAFGAGMQPVDAAHLASTLAKLPAAEFNRRAGQIRDALNNGDKNGAMRLVGLADAAYEAVSKSGGGQAIQAEVTRRADGFHFSCDRPVSEQQAANLIFQGGRVPDGAKLVRGDSNNWTVQFPNDFDSQQDVVDHFNSHMETIDNLHPRQPTFTWVMNPAHPIPPGSHRKDLHNEFGFKINKHYPLDQGQIRTEQLKSAFGTGAGHGYELQFDKPMTKEEVMDKLFDKRVKFNRADVKLEAVPQEPSNVYEVKISGIDAASAIKGPYMAAFGDAVTFNKDSMPPNLPSGLRGQFENHTIPPNAKKFPPDTYVWEQDGYIAHVKTDGKGYYEPEATKMPQEPALKKTIQYFMEDKGIPPREAWQAFDKHWDELDREMIMALMSFYASAAGVGGGAPEAEITAARRSPKIGGRIGEDLESDATTEARAAKPQLGGQAEKQEAGLATTEERSIGAKGGPKRTTVREDEEAAAQDRVTVSNSDRGKAKGTDKPTSAKETEGTAAKTKPRGVDPKDNEKIRQLDDWDRKGKFIGDPSGLKARLRKGDPEARQEFEEMKAEIASGKKPNVEDFEDTPHSTNVVKNQRISDANKMELENSGWLKGRLPNADHRRDFMKWLEENHRVGEPHIHLRPGSPEAEAALQQFSEEEGVALAGARPR